MDVAIPKIAGEEVTAMRTALPVLAFEEMAMPSTLAQPVPAALSDGCDKVAGKHRAVVADLNGLRAMQLMQVTSSAKQLFMGQVRLKTAARSGGQGPAALSAPSGHLFGMPTVVTGPVQAPAKRPATRHSGLRR